MIVLIEAMKFCFGCFQYFCLMCKGCIRLKISLKCDFILSHVHILYFIKCLMTSWPLMFQNGLKQFDRTFKLKNLLVSTENVEQRWFSRTCRRKLLCLMFMVWSKHEAHTWWPHDCTKFSWAQATADFLEDCLDIFK